MRIRIILLAVLVTAACHHDKAAPTTTTGGASDQSTLYSRLGGQDAIKAVVKDFVEQNVANDQRIIKFFKGVDIPGLEQKLVDQICEATGGPCKYTGKDMKTAHANMGVKQADFDALVEDLSKSLDKFKVAPKDKSDLLGALAKMQPDIVTAQ